MSSSSKGDGENALDVEELLQIGSRCRELRKEKDMLRESQSQSFGLIKRLEVHVKSLSEARNEDKKHIQKLETELRNCSQEIDYLRDQLNAWNEEVHCLSEHAHSLKLKLVDLEILQDKVGQLEDKLKISDSKRLLLIEELRSKEEELQKSALCIEKLEESISSSVLESQCEIESLKLDIMALEQTCAEAKKIEKESVQEKARTNSLTEELKVRIQDAEELIEHLDRENKELKEKLLTSEINARVFGQKIEEWMEKADGRQLNAQSCVGELERNLTISEEMGRFGLQETALLGFCSLRRPPSGGLEPLVSSWGKVFGAFLSKLVLVAAADADLKEKIENMSLQICDYEVLVKQLKEELREEKSKAKEEAEDLAQEMAELRYQMTCLLEEECKRRACIEQASLQRIAELEAQIHKEKKRCDTVGRYLHEA